MLLHALCLWLGELIDRPISFAVAPLFRSAPPHRLLCLSFQAGKLGDHAARVLPVDVE